MFSSLAALLEFEYYVADLLELYSVGKSSLVTGSTEFVYRVSGP